MERRQPNKAADTRRRKNTAKDNTNRPNENGSVSTESDSFEKNLEIAKTEKLTFYDSSYIHFAKEKALQLITEDKELKAKAQKYVKAQTITTAILESSFGTDKENI